MKVDIRKYEANDVDSCIEIWNQIVEDGVAFPQLELLTTGIGNEFFESQYTAVAIIDEKIVGLYTLHPNNVGRAGHIANASFAVSKDCRGLYIGEKLVINCLEQAKNLEYKILQFNAVVDSNIHALNLYRRVGFVDMGIIPGGFLKKDGVYEDIHVMYYVL